MYALNNHDKVCKPIVLKGDRKSHDFILKHQNGDLSTMWSTMFQILHGYQRMGNSNASKLYL